MRAKRAERERARELRAEGRSVRAIAAELGVAQSSVSVWVRDVPVTPEQRAALDERERRAPRSLRPPRPEMGSSGLRRRCSKCERDLPVEAFNRSGGGWQWYCRECFSGYFRSRGAKHLAQTKAALVERRARARAMVSEHLAANPCADCGEPDPIVLELDHLRDKVRSVAELVAAGDVGRLPAELAKCEVACVNCHRRRTATRGGWARATRTFPPSWTSAQRLGTVVVWDHLLAEGCTDCGEDDLVVLDFDHRRDKLGSPATMASKARPLADVYREMAKCDVRCANCHRRRTAEVLGWRKVARARTITGPP